MSLSQFISLSLKIILSFSASGFLYLAFEFGAQLLGAHVAKVCDLGKVVTGVDHQQRVGQTAFAKGFFSAAQHDQRVFAAREQQCGALKDCSDFAQNENGLFFQRIQVVVAERVEQMGFCTGVHGVLIS